MTEPPCVTPDDLARVADIPLSVDALNERINRLRSFAAAADARRVELGLPTIHNLTEQEQPREHR